MAQSNPHNLTEQELAGRWVAVDPRGGIGLRHLPSGAALVDYDTELDLLCQRVAEAGLKRLTIFKYEGRYEASDSYRGPRGSA